MPSEGGHPEIWSGVEYSLLRHLLPGVDVGVLRLLKGALQHLQLLGREGGPGASLLPLERDARLALNVTVVAACTTCQRGRG